MSVTKKYEDHLSRTRSFSEGETVETSQETSSTAVTPRKKIFSYTKKTGPSLNCRLVKLKDFALGAKRGPTSKCHAPRCKCCELVKGTQDFKVNGKKVNASPGNCLSYNIIYLFNVVSVKRLTSVTLLALYGLGLENIG